MKHSSDDAEVEHGQRYAHQSLIVFLFFLFDDEYPMNQRRDNREGETNVKDKERERQSVFAALILLAVVFLRAPTNLASPATLILLMCLDSSP